MFALSAALYAAAFWPISPGPNSGVASVPNSTAPSVRFSLPCVSISSSIARIRRLLGSLSDIDPESSTIASRFDFGVHAADATPGAAAQATVASAAALSASLMRRSSAHALSASERGAARLNACTASIAARGCEPLVEYEPPARLPGRMGTSGGAVGAGGGPAATRRAGRQPRILRRAWQHAGGHPDPRLRPGPGPADGHGDHRGGDSRRAGAQDRAARP